MKLDTSKAAAFLGAEAVAKFDADIKAAQNAL